MTQLSLPPTVMELASTVAIQSSRIPLAAVCEQQWV